MKQITLLCVAGMSTSLLVSKMKEAAAKRQLNVEIMAMPKDSLDGDVTKTDLILLGPQIRYLLDEVKSKYEPRGIKVDVVNIMDYGMMNGEKVLEDAMKYLE